MSRFKLVKVRSLNICIGFLFMFFQPQICSGQDLIINGSFEGKALKGNVLDPEMEIVYSKGKEFIFVVPNWLNFGQYKKSPVDIHSNSTRFWDVEFDAKDGNTFIGMVARYDGSQEAIAQILEVPILKKRKYKFSIWHAVAPAYNSTTGQQTIEPEAFLEPCKLQVKGMKIREFAMFNPEFKGDVLGESDFIVENEWNEFEFEFVSNRRYDVLILQIVNFGSPFFSNGHILIDKASLEQIN